MIYFTKTEHKHDVNWNTIKKYIIFNTIKKEFTELKIKSYSSDTDIIKQHIKDKGIKWKVINKSIY